MDNPVVVRVAEVAAEEGLATLRFNFRGVCASTGSHGGGHDERRDVDAALDRLRHRLGDVPVRLAGYSFGATVAAGVTIDRGDVAGLVLVAPPLAMTGRKPFLGLRGTARPLLIVAGSRDEYCPRTEVAGLAAELPGAALEIVEDADHFFLGKLFPLGEALRRWVRS
jgi:alpha/beta superfamily hydrolase